MNFKYKHFRNLIKENRWTIVALAKKLSVGRSTIHFWLNGEHLPSKSKIIELSKLLHIPISELIEIGPDSKNDENKARRKEETLHFSVNSLFDTKDFDSKLNGIDKAVDEIRAMEKQRSLIGNAILHSNSIPIYIKDHNQSYIMANKVFYEMIGLSDDFKIQKKMDKNIFTADEAKFNTEEDYKVLTSGTPVRNSERVSPGSRRAKICLASKVPIFDHSSSNPNPVGVIGMFADITQVKQNEMHLSTMKNSIQKMQLCFWYGKGLIKDKDGIYKVKNISFQQLEGNIEQKYKELNLNTAEQIRTYHNSIILSEERKMLDFRKVKDLKTFSSFYDVLNPMTGSPTRIYELIQYFPDDDSFGGILLANPSQCYTAKENNLLKKLLNEYNVPPITIKKILQRLANS